MVASTLSFKEVTGDEYEQATQELMKCPHNTRLVGAYYTLRQNRYIARGTTEDAYTATITADLAPHQTFAQGFVTATMQRNQEVMKPSLKAARSNVLVLSTDSTFFTNCADVEKQSDGKVCAVKFKTPERMCMAPGSQCDAYVAYSKGKQASPLLTWQIFKVNVGELSKFVSLETKVPAVPSHQITGYEVKTLAA